MALKLIFQPHRWQKGRFIRILEEAFAHYFDFPYAVSFASGRLALYQILKGWGIGGGDDVIVPAYTCVVVPDAVIWSGATPIYADIEEDTFNVDYRKLDRVVTGKTRAIIVQHTFGQTTDLEEIITWARRRKIKVIEDCAHSLGIEYKGSLLGTFGDAAFFSFGQDKSISSVRGGLVITRDPHLGRALETAQKTMAFPTRLTVLKRIAHPILWGVINSTYYFFNLGKLFTFLAWRGRILGDAVSKGELGGKPPKDFSHRLSNALAALAYLQFRRIEDFNRRRRQIAIYYRQNLGNISAIKLPRTEGGKELALLRFTLRVPDPGKLAQAGKKAHIILGSWYNAIPFPKGVDREAVKYKPGSCPIAEKVAAQTVNLPTSPTMELKDAERVVKLVKKHYS